MSVPMVIPKIIIADEKANVPKAPLVHVCFVVSR